MNFVAFKRELQGTGASRRLRNGGKVPGIVFGAGEPQMIELDHNALFHALKKEAFHSSILDMEFAGKVQKGGKNVLPEDVERARRQGATDQEIHDTVLIAAAFCMYNRYVDGLATWAPTDLSGYRERARRVTAEGYSPIPHQLATK